MATRIQQRLGLSGSVSLDSLTALLIGMEEDSGLEAKSIPSEGPGRNLSELSGEDRQLVSAWGVQELGVSAAVGLLNKFDGSGGLVVLGAIAPNGVITSLKPVPNSTLSKIEGAISNRIGSSANLLGVPTIAPLRIPAGSDESISLVEVHPNDRSSVFYSMISNHAYVREADDTRKLTIPEFIQLHESRRIAKCLIDVLNPRLEGESGQRAFVAELCWRNVGNVPGRFVAALLNFHGDVTADSVAITGGSVQDVSALNRSARRSYSAECGYPPTSKLVYPKLSLVLGELRIKGITGQKSILLQVAINEDRGTSEQWIAINVTDSVVSVSPGDPAFSAY
jgi:hypothetical protein